MLHILNQIAPSEFVTALKQTLLHKLAFTQDHS